ncbi:hypothetical protein NLJ89_g2766 [Agrocybe chaxingu]|uniref:F-box domain-containing protein n=1 Tax=Agrocybe chaxingu TaxID=84603 RepID=A0A9W8MYL2_9AGAR|nr:hypothetical protein NLJ89_g2766 [Agrocybe chaxingu]
MDDKFGYANKPPIFLNDLFDAVIRQPHRLRRLIIRLSSTRLDFEAMDANRMDMASSLQEVLLHISEHPFLLTFATSRPALPWLQSLPNLTKLSLMGISRAPIVSNLTSLTLQALHATHGHAKAIFTASPNLMHLILADLCPLHWPYSLSPEKIEAPSLRSLAVSLSRTYGDSSSIYLPSVLHAPNLSYLEIDGDLSFYQVFGPSISLPKIETVRISDYHDRIFVDHPPYEQRDINLFHSLTSLRHLQLINVPVDSLLTRPETKKRGLVRRRSMNTPKPVEQETSGASQLAEGLPAQGLPWPELRSITLDTLRSSTVLSLCQYVSAHGGIRKIELSRNAMRHLTGSLRREGDRIFQPVTFADRLTQAQIWHYCLLWTPAGRKDVREWLSKLVEIRDMEPQLYGMLDPERMTLGEMV